MFLWTVGHSTRTKDEFLDLLASYSVRTIVDIRSVPRSRKNPQFNREDLEKAAGEAGIEYIYLKELGGLRKPQKDSVNLAWRNDSFRGYADYMQSEDFHLALAHLVEIARDRPTAIMCAEVLPWRCHRSLIADALLIRGFEVIEILSKDKSRPHQLTSFAVVEGDRITYPADAQELAA